MITDTLFIICTTITLCVYINVCGDSKRTTLNDYCASQRNNRNTYGIAASLKCFREVVLLSLSYSSLINALAKAYSNLVKMLGQITKEFCAKIINVSMHAVKHDRSFE